MGVLACCVVVGTGAIALLAFWCFLMQFVQNSSYNYLGALASFTPIVIIYGYRLTGISKELSVERYALVRMEEIAIGIVIAVVLSSLLWPVSSIRLLRSEMMVSVQSFKNAVEHMMTVYDKLIQDDHGRNAAHSAHSHEHRPPSTSTRAEQKTDKAEEEEGKTGGDDNAIQLQIEMITEGRSNVQASASRPACVRGDMSDEGQQPQAPPPSTATDTQEKASQHHTGTTHTQLTH